MQKDLDLPPNHHLIEIVINGWRLLGIAKTSDSVMAQQAGRRSTCVGIDNITPWDDADYFLMGQGEDIDAYTLKAIKKRVVAALNKSDASSGDWSKHGLSLSFKVKNSQKYYRDIQLLEGKERVA